MAIGACIRGFVSSMRHVFAVDATHLKGKYKGVLFVANAFDSNRQIYPVAFGLGDLEIDASWEWFCSKLYLAIGECPNLVVFSDRNVSIGNTLMKVLPSAQHDQCFYHMKGNIKCSFKLKKGDNLLYEFEQAAKLYHPSEFARRFRKIKARPTMATYLQRVGPNRWSRPHMDGRRYNVMTTNIAKFVNSVLRFASMQLVLHLIDHIVNILLRWLTERRDLAGACQLTLCPEFGEKKLRKRLEDAARMNIIKINHVEHNVVDGDLGGQVHLGNQTCSYQKFDLEQLPCKHIVAVCRFLKINVYSLASWYDTTNTWLDAYTESLYRVRPQQAWVIPPEIASRVVLPPIAKVMSGRRKMVRIASQGEDKVKRRCSRCGNFGHYKITCKEHVLVGYVE